MYDFDPAWWRLVVERQAQFIAEAERDGLARAASSSLVRATVARWLRRTADRLQPIPQAKASL